MRRPLTRRRPLLATCAVGLVVVGGDLGAQARAEAPGQFPAGVSVVTVDVVVTDEAGRPVTGLPREAFRLREDGQPRQVVQFEAVQLAEPAPGEALAVSRRRAVSSNAAAAADARTIAVVFDDIHVSAGAATRRGQDAVRQLLAAVTPRDRLLLASTSGSAWWASGSFAPRGDLVAILARLHGQRPEVAPVGGSHLSDWEAKRIHERDRAVSAMVARRLSELGVVPDLLPDSDGLAVLRESGVLDEERPYVRALAEEVYQRGRDRRRVTLRRLARVVDAVAGARGRKSVVLVSEGFVSEPEKPESRDLVMAARRANAAVYLLDVRANESGLPAIHSIEMPYVAEGKRAVGEQSTSFDAPRLEAEGAVSVALDTGGFVAGRGADVGDAARRIADESRVYYLLGFVPSSATDGRFHEIGVDVQGERLTVRARRGFWAEAGRRGEDEEKDDRELAPEVREALDAAVDSAALPLRLAAYAREDAGPRVRTVFVAEVDRAALAAGAGKARLDCWVAAASRDRPERAAQSATVEVTRTPASGALAVPLALELSPGPWQARVVVRDRATGRLASVTHELDVPPAGRLRISTPVIGEPEAVPGGGVRLAPGAHRDFAAGRPVYAQFEVHGAPRDAPVVSGFVLVGPDGRERARLEPTPLPAAADGRRSRVLRLPVAEPGDYELRLGVRDQRSGEERDRSEAFRVLAGPAPGMTGEAR